MKLQPQRRPKESHKKYVARRKKENVMTEIKLKGNFIKMFKQPNRHERFAIMKKNQRGMLKKNGPETRKSKSAGRGYYIYQRLLARAGVV